MDGSLGLVYVCGEQSGGEIAVVDALRGSKIRGLFAAGEELVALVGAWELQWCGLQSSRGPADSTYLNQTVTSGLQNVKVCQLAGGRAHCVALSLDGQLFSWGTRDDVKFAYGELGRTSSSNARLGHRRTPTPQVRPESDCDRKSASPATSPRKQDLDASMPHLVQVSKDLFFTKIACGRHHSAAVTNKGDLYTWGRNFEGQLGQSLRTLSSEHNAVVHGICAWPKYVSAFLSRPRVADVCCGDMFTVVLLDDGSVYRFGERFVGVTHASTSEEKYSCALRLLIRGGFDGSPFTGVACGSAHALAVTSGGEIFAWGLNTYGQLGLGDLLGDKSSAPTSKKSALSSTSNPIGGCNVPVVVRSDVKWAKVFAGHNYSAALDQHNRLFTWGCGKYGNLGHCDGRERSSCEYAPRPIDQFRHVFISSVVCGPRNLYAFAPSRVESVTPVCGEITGGYELRVRGSGFWASEDVTVRFIPLKEGCLQRGSVGEFVEETGEIVCRMPKFAVPGEFAVEVSMNGKNFTSNGRMFTAFKRPQIVAVSASEARFADGEEISLSMRGNLPKICQKPILRLVKCSVDDEGRYCGPSTNDASASRRGASSLTAVGYFDSDASESEAPGNESDSIDGHLLRFQAPVMTPLDTVEPHTIEISYDGGLNFSLVRVHAVLASLSEPHGLSESAVSRDRSSEAADRQSPVHVIFFHDARIARVRPNSFPVQALPRRLEVECSQILPATVIRSKSVSVSILRVESAAKTNEAGLPPPTAVITASIAVQDVVGSSIVGTIPPLSEWEYKSEAAVSTKPKNGRKPSRAIQNPRVTEWWKAHAKAGFFSAEVRVSLNDGRTFLPSVSPASNQVFGIVAAMRQPLSVFPNVGVQDGGTQVSVSADFLHFDTQDAVLCLRSRGAEVRVPAVCVCPDALASANPTPMDRRVVFQTPAMPPPLPPAPSTDESEAVEPQEAAGDHYHEVEVLVSLDGEHFTETGPRFTFCEAPEVLGASPECVQPGDKVSLSIEKLVPSTSACVKLVVPGDKDVSFVVPVQVQMETRTAQFEFPELPLQQEEQVELLFSVNGQDFPSPAPFVDQDASNATSQSPSEPRKVSVCYRPMTPSDGSAGPPDTQA